LIFNYGRTVPGSILALLAQKNIFTGKAREMPEW